KFKRGDETNFPFLTCRAEVRRSGCATPPRLTWTGARYWLPANPSSANINASMSRTTPRSASSARKWWSIARRDKADTLGYCQPSSNLLPMLWLVEFMFPRRLHRLAYFIRGMALETVSAILCASSTSLAPRYWWLWVIVLTIYELFFIVLP